MRRCIPSLLPQVPSAGQRSQSVQMPLWGRAEVVESLSELRSLLWEDCSLNELLFLCAVPQLWCWLYHSFANTFLKIFLFKLLFELAVQLPILQFFCYVQQVCLLFFGSVTVCNWLLLHGICINKYKCFCKIKLISRKYKSSVYLMLSNLHLQKLSSPKNNTTWKSFLLHFTHSGFRFTRSLQWDLCNYQ